MSGKQNRSTPDSLTLAGPPRDECLLAKHAFNPMEVWGHFLVFLPSATRLPDSSAMD